MRNPSYQIPAVTVVSPEVRLGKLRTWDRASLIAKLIKNLPAMQETKVQFLGQEDPLEKGMAPHSSILGVKNPPAMRETWV